jgi:DNA-binding MarR family transcriptional regulator
MLRIEGAGHALVSLIDVMHEAGTPTFPEQAASITPGAVRVMQHVQNHPGAGVLDVAGCTGLAKPTVSLLVKDLAAKGIVSREAEKEDGRRICLHLTRKGEKLYKLIQAYRAKKAEKILSCLNDEETETVGSLMIKIVEYWRKT